MLPVLPTHSTLRSSAPSTTRIAKNALFLAGIVVLAVAVLLGITFALAAAAARFDGDAMMEVVNLRTGLIGALLVALIFATFHLRKATVQLRVSSRDAFLRRMRKIFDDLGLVVIQKRSVVWRTKPAFRSMMFGEGITMVLDGNVASITGPSLSLDQIRRRYRMLSHLEKLQESIADSRLRGPETFMKRFELSARLDPEQLVLFHEKVVSLLGNGANVVLDVQLMAASDTGIRESVWVNQIRPWLEEEAICYDFHRDHAQQTSPLNSYLPDVASTPSMSDSATKTDPNVLDSCLWSTGELRAHLSDSTRR